MTSAPLDTTVHTLHNGVRIVALRLPHLRSASVSVFVRSGSVHEAARFSGISHVVEHMAFRGTRQRDGRQINLDAERLGAEVNAHTDKDHTAFHMRGMAADAAEFVRMLADIVQHPSFPEAELERERQVLLQEYIEDEDDPLSAAFTLFDKACYGAHPWARPVMGARRVIERLQRADLQAYVRAQYTGANVIVGAAGDIDPQAIVDTVQACFGDLPAGRAHAVSAPIYLGGAQARRVAGSSQSHVVLGYPIVTAREPAQAAGQVAAALFGEGMSSPLMNELRERRGLVYYAACSADVTELSGQFVIEASTTPPHLDELFAELARLLGEHAQGIDAVALARARQQIAVRRLLSRERPYRQLEDAVHDVHVHGRVRGEAELRAEIDDVTAEQAREVFARMLAVPAAVALAGRLGTWSRQRLQDWGAAGVPASNPQPASNPWTQRT